MTTTNISLNSLWEIIQSDFNKNEIFLFDGFINDNANLPIIHCNFNQISDLNNYIKLFKINGSNIMISSFYKISHEEIQNAINNLHEDQEATIDKLKQELLKEECISFIVLSFLSSNPKAIFSLEIQSELHELMFEDDGYEDDDENEDENFFDDEDEEDTFSGVNYLPRYSAGAIEEYATKLANDSKFHICTSHDQRLVLAKRLFSEKVNSHDGFPLYEITTEATSIFKIDILPKIEEVLSEKAHKLLEDGMNKKDIALKLGITLNKLSKLL